MKLVHTPMATSQIYIRAANGNMSQNGNGNGKRRKGQGQGDDDVEGQGEAKKRKGTSKGKGSKGKGGKGGGKGKSRGNGGGDAEQLERNAAWQAVLKAPTDLQNGNMSPDDSQVMEDVGGETGGDDSKQVPTEADMSIDPSAALFAGPQPDADRQVLWLDEMVSSCLRVVDFEFGRDQTGNILLPKNLSESMVVRVMSFYFSASLEFAWKKTLTLSGRTLKQWTHVRHALQDLIRNAFIEMKSGCSNSGDNSGSGSASAMVLGHNSSNAIVSRLLFLGFNILTSGSQVEMMGL